VINAAPFHATDFAPGHLLTGGNGGESGIIWNLPVMIERGVEYQKEWTHGRQCPPNLPDGPAVGSQALAAQIEVPKHDAYTFCQSVHCSGPVQHLRARWFDMAGFE